MKVTREGPGPWKTKIAWLPMQFDETWIWLERYERRRIGWSHQYRLPGSDKIFVWYY